MMFRRDAVELLRPRRKLGYVDNADSYLACVSHMMGGTLALEKPLVLRGIHSRNAWFKEKVISIFQMNHRSTAIDRGLDAKMDAIEAFFLNRGNELFRSDDIAATLQLHFTPEQMEEIHKHLPGKGQ